MAANAVSVSQLHDAHQLADITVELCGLPSQVGVLPWIAQQWLGAATGNFGGLARAVGGRMLWRCARHDRLVFAVASWLVVIWLSLATNCTRKIGDVKAESDFSPGSLGCPAYSSLYLSSGKAEGWSCMPVETNEVSRDASSRMATARM